MKLGKVLKLNKASFITIEDNEKYRIAGVQNYGQGIVIRREVLGSELTMRKYQVISENQLMWCKVDTKNGAFGLTHKEHIGALASPNMALADIDTSIYNPEFLEILFRQKPFADYITKLSSGTTNRKYLTPNQLFETVKLPDLNIIEQKAFIKKLKRIEGINFGLQITNQKKLLSQLKQAILQEAIQGKLTADWRAQNIDVEPASELLKRIKAEKEKLVKEKKLKTGKTINHPVSLIDDLSIPNGWTWCKADDIFFVTKLAGFEYTNHISLRETGEVPVIRAQNVRPVSIDKTNLLYIDNKTSLLLDRCSLTKECLLVTFIGAGIGDVATFNENERWHLAPNVAKMEPFIGCEKLLSVKYLNYYLLSAIGRKEIFKHVKATAQPSLSMGTIRDIDFAFPPFEEQVAIVEKVEALMDKCRVLETEITQSEKLAQMLMQSVLKEAFEPTSATEPEAEETIAMSAEPAEAFGKQGEFGF